MSSCSASLKSQKSEIRLWVFFRQGAFSCRSIGTTIGNAVMYFPKAALTACGGRAWPISMTKSPTPLRTLPKRQNEIGNASWRERGCQYGLITVGAGTNKKKKK